MDLSVGTTDDGFDEIIKALTVAEERWASTAPATYAFRVEVMCDCPDEGSRWVRAFDGWPDEGPWDVERLFERIRDDLDGGASRIELASSPETGLPLWYLVEGEDDLMLAVEDFHEILAGPTDFDGVWRFTVGALDGRRITTPATGGILLTIGDGYLSFPIDCNEAWGQVDILGTAFGVGTQGTTAIFCGERSEQAEWFSRAISRATTIEREGSELVISGRTSILRLVSLEHPERLGELPLTAAGETLLIEPPAGTAPPVYTISPAGLGRFEGHPSRHVSYSLTASDTNPDWSDWTGEFEVPPPAPGPHQIVMPGTITAGDYQLCAPYWADDFICYDLLVRPPSAPWYVTAGPGGVVLHDADGTSQTVGEAEADIAFWIDGRAVVQSLGGEIIVDDEPLTTAGDSVLLDVARAGDRVEALIVQGGATTVVDVDTSDVTRVGPTVIEGRLAGDRLVVRTAPDHIEARSRIDGTVAWDLPIDEQTMITSVDDGAVRLDRFGQVATDATTGPLWQYLSTRLIDMETGEVVEEFQFELAVPEVGDEIADRCVRAELRDGILLCPQPDGRFITVVIEGGDMTAIPESFGTIGTFVR